MRRLILLVCVLVLLPSVVSARTWYVNPDGSGDAVDIYGGFSLASRGDTVLVAAGTYGTVYLKDGVVLKSEDGPEHTILDAGGNETCVIAPSPDSVEINGFTITNARWKGVHVSGSSPNYGHVVVRGNRIVDCGWDGGGALFLGGVGAVVDSNYIDCPQAVEGIETSAVTGWDVTISHNRVRTWLRGINTYEDATIEYNLVNGAYWGIQIQDGAPVLRNNTIIGCTIGLYALGPVGAYGTFHKNIVAHCGTGVDAAGCYSRPTLDCNLFWSNSTDYSGFVPGPNDFYEDPLFCNPDAGDYTLQDCSPCVAGYGCGEVGAYGVGCPCGGVSTEPTTWGKIKAEWGE